MAIASKTYRVIGLMSGTSLDGLDIAFCSLINRQGKWSYTIHEAETIKYSKVWLEKLMFAPSLSAEKLLELHNDYGKLLGTCIQKFVGKYSLKRIDLVASHGHTIFHQPSQYFTFQLGHGAAISATCKLPVVSDFRTMDVLLGGQGAPLIPICDMLLFPVYSYCLNLGGFANISYQKVGKGKRQTERIAFDICPVNTALNHLARMVNEEYDNGGHIAASAEVNDKLLAQLNSLAYYKLPAPKSLGREWLESEFLSVVDDSGITIPEKLATITEHIAIQIAASLKQPNSGKCLVTGGGAFNKFLVKRISEKTQVRLEIPDKKLVNFKEALGFALLGVLKIRGEVNCLKSVTGAAADNIGGVLWDVGN